MTYTGLIFLTILAMGIFTFAGLPKGGWRGGRTIIFIGLSAFIYLGAFEILGNSKPIWLELFPATKLRVVGMYLIENKSIHVWVLRNGVPRAYVYPWPKKEKAEELQKRWRERHETGDEFYLADEKDEVAHIEGPPPLPQKE